MGDSSALRMALASLLPHTESLGSRPLLRSDAVPVQMSASVVLIPFCGEFPHSVQQSVVALIIVAVAVVVAFVSSVGIGTAVAAVAVAAVVVVEGIQVKNLEETVETPQGGQHAHGTSF